jgi:integral membrane protein
MLSMRHFIILGRWEACSLLLLMGVAMPLKYMYGLPEAVRVVGMAHGLLFMAYCAAALEISRSEKWAFAKLLRCWIASCLPLGTFFFERELRSSAV